MFQVARSKPFVRKDEGYSKTATPTLIPFHHYRRFPLRRFSSTDTHLFRSRLRSQTGFCPFLLFLPRLISFGPLSRLPLNEQTIFHQGVFLHPVSTSSSSSFFLFFFFFLDRSYSEIFLKYYPGIFKYLFPVSVAIWRSTVSDTILININALFI